MALESFFNPGSVAVVGASAKQGKVGHEILSGILKAGFAGRIFPINPHADQIEGLKCFPDLASIGEVPELVIIVVPAAAVPGVMQQCVNIGVKNVIIITAGFKEVGPEGAELENRLVRIARQGGVRVIGPNCLGLIVPKNKLNASFGGELPVTGALAYLSQSGALMAAILDMANAGGIGFSELVSIGNKADVDELDIIRAFGQDDDTKVIAGYLENIRDGNAFVREAENISQHKPILLIKSGGTEAGAKAASSHTGSLAGGETAYEAVFDRAGIIRCSSIKQQFEYSQAFAYQPLPQGSRAAVITNAGGPGIMAADEIERQGLKFARLSDQTMSTLERELPAAANVHNPVDVLGDALADRYEFALSAVLDDENVDMVLVLLTPQAMTQPAETANVLVKVASHKKDKPILACFLGAKKVDDAKRILRQGGIPTYESPESSVRTMKVMADYVRWKKRPKRIVKLFPVNRRKVENIIDRHLRQGIREVDEMESKDILEAYGFVTPKGSVATTAEQAAAAANQLGYPVVLKIVSPDILHKSDVGGVRVGLRNATEVMDAFDLMMFRTPKVKPDANIVGVLVQQMCTTGREVILGMNRDKRFGPLMMFGMGGTMVEVLKDVSFYLAPLTAEEAKEMLMNTRTYRMLEGVRGQQGVDIDAIAEGLQRLSQLVTEFPQIQEMDINPYMVGPANTIPVAVDARISVEKV
jgi:acetyl coenzyme A synthetase (ADP forming)-like protein